MLDLHCHILPGVDDGPPTMEQAIEMAVAAFRDGTCTIVAAPHSRDVNERSSIACVRTLAERLNEELRARSIPLDVLLGMENHLALDTPEQVDAGTCLPIEGTRCILIELPFEFYPYHTRDTLRSLRNRGLTPVVVHPERNLAIQREPQLLASLVQDGVVSQITAGSLTGDMGLDAQHSAEKLLRLGLAHVIASDGHAPSGTRAPQLSRGVAAAAAVVGDEAARRMVDSTPRAMLESRVK
ncbi:MAG: tyrosine protein phosphatase [Chloroflexota bacterium]|nr:tyrosine protein phosphatase [Chloroflexota bacterium]